MNEKTYKALEYEKIVEMLRCEAASNITQEEIKKMKPCTQHREIEELQEQTKQAFEAILAKGNVPLGDFHDLKEILEFANKGRTLSMKELLQVHHDLCVAEEVKGYFDEEIKGHYIKEIANLLCVFPMLEQDIDRCIVSESEMSDNASHELRHIRRDILRKNEQIREKLSAIISKSENKSLLQDSLVTMRNGRYVVPVKQEHKSKIGGIVHDQSQTGATLFIEPQVIVNLNNELRELQLAEIKEIERILSELSAAVAAKHKMILNNQNLLMELDLIFARARLGLVMGAFAPKTSTNAVDLRQARHPLLERDKVVPLDIVMDTKTRVLIITGPNTGGKTVTLKTLGLLALMFQSGLMIPASEGSSLPIFEKIFADIGDEQSIEQSLSTFSSHMKNIVSIMEESDDKSLILLDELGAGTDPQEGASLAISILEEILNKKAVCIATTHYTELKKFALDKEGVNNASMEFDIDTLSPTYRLLIGLPGKSNAFEISKKLGLKEEIITRAKSLVNSRDMQFENILEQIESERKKAEQEREEAVAIGVLLKSKKADFDKEKAKFDAKKDKLLEKAKEEAVAIIKEAESIRKEVQLKLKDIDLMDSMAERNARMLESKRELEKARSKYSEKIAVPQDYKPVTVDMLKIGDLVKVISLGQNGTILSLPDSKGEMSVQVGNLKANVHIKNIIHLSHVNKMPSMPKTKTKYASIYKNKAQAVSLSINVRGKLLDEALAEVDKYLDDAFIAKLDKVSIIHGRGEGILRKGIQEMLTSHRHVKQYRNGAFNEGGNGVTIVELKR